jgi:hypothetical protein
VKAGFSVNITAPAGCAATAQTLDFPIVASGHPVTATEKTAGIVDQQMDSGGDTAHVYCSWFSETAPYSIDAGIMTRPGGDRRTISMNSELTEGMSQVGGIGFQTKDLDYGGVCNFSVIKLDPTTRSVWGSFTCDSLKQASTTPTPCAVSTSYFYFENCTKP